MPQAHVDPAPTRPESVPKTGKKFRSTPSSVWCHHAAVSESQDQLRFRGAGSINPRRGKEQIPVSENEKHQQKLCEACLRPVFHWMTIDADNRFGKVRLPSDSTRN